MIKTTFFCWIAFLFCFQLQAQDLLVTLEGDSLNCQILKETKKEVTYKYKIKNQEFTTTISKMAVARIAYNYYTTSEVNNVSLINKPPKFQLGINVGWGYRIAPLDKGSINPGLHDHFKKLKSSLVIEPYIDFYFNDRFGIGLKHSMSTSKATLEDVQISLSSGNTYRGTLDDKIKISYTGPVFNFRIPKESITLLFRGSLGLIHYKNTLQVSNATGSDTFYLKGLSAGTFLEANVAFTMNNNLHLNAGIGLLSASLVSVELQDGSYTDSIDTEEDLSRIEFKVGISFGK